MKRILRPITYVLATLYFLVDAAFMAVAKPISDWLARHVILRRLRVWIRSLRPYPSFALFSVPVIMLEPVNRDSAGVDSFYWTGLHTSYLAQNAPAALPDSLSVDSRHPSRTGGSIWATLLFA